MSTPRATPAELIKGERELAAALAEKSDVELTCRGMRHAWHETGMTWQMPTEKGDLPTVKMRWDCMRECGVVRHDILTVKPVPRGRGYSIVNRSVGHYTYPEGYQIPGIPRGVKPSVVLWQEYFRRAMENAAGALPGDRATAS